MNLLALGVIKAALLLLSAQSAEIEPPIQKRIDAIQSIHNVSDQMLLVNIESFVSDHRPDLRIPDKFSHPKYFDPKDKELKLSTIDLMRQAIYGTQMRLRDIDFVLKKYEKNLPFQMAFLFNRLDQLVVDMRRIYTLAWAARDSKRVYQHIIWYEHSAKKYVDVLYIVQFVMDTHEAFMKDTKSRAI